MNSFFSLIVLIVIGVAIFAAYQYLAEQERQTTEKERFGGFEQAEMSSGEKQLLSTFRREQDANKIFDRIGLYHSEYKIKDSTNEEIETRHYPESTTTTQTEDGFCFNFSLPQGISGKDFIKKIDRGGDLFPDHDLTYEAISEVPGRAKIITHTRKAGQNKIGKEFLQ